LFVVILFYIDTSDLQALKITEIRSDVYSFQCVYLNASNVSGCVYALISGVEEVDNITGWIHRDSSGAIHQLLSPSLGCYDEFLAYINTTDPIVIRTPIIADGECFSKSLLHIGMSEI
jgi:hypothetical protein